MDFLTRSIYKGKPCKYEIAALRKKIDERDGGSMMQFITVYCATLATVLDRLEALENYQEEILKVANNHISIE